MTPAEQASHLLRVASRRMTLGEIHTLERVRDGLDLGQPELGESDASPADTFRRIVTEFASDLK